MIARFLALPLRTQMLLIILVTVSVPFVTILLTARQQYAWDTHDAYHQTLGIADDVAADQGTMVSGTEQLLTTLAYIPAVEHRDTAGVSHLLAELLRKSPHMDNLMMADPSGSVWASAVPLPRPLTLADRTSFRDAVATRHFSVGDYVVSRVTGKQGLQVAVPFLDDRGQVRDVGVVCFSLAEMAEHIREAEQLPHISLLITDRKGTILLSTSDPRLIGTPDRDDLFHQMRDGTQEGTFKARGLTDVQRLFAYKKVRLPGEQQPYLYVRAGVDADSVTSRSRAALVTNVSTLGAMTLLALGLAYYLSKKGILDKVEELREATRKVTAGDLSVRVAGNVVGGELGELGEAFNEMIQQLERDAAERHRAETRLHESELRFRTLIEQAGEAFELLDEEGRFVDVNAACCRQLGYSKEELLRLTVFAVDPYWTMERYTATFTALMDSPPYTFESVHRRKDGIMLSVEITSSILLLGEKHYSFSLVRDITVRKRAEQDLQKSEHLLKTIINIIPACISYVGPDLRYRLANQAYEQWFGTSPAWMEGKHVRDVLGNTLWESIAPGIQRAMSGEKVSFQHLFQGMQWHNVELVPFRDTSGHPSGYVAHVTNITEIKLAAEEVRRARDAAEAANETKSRFLANMSHELRTPMNGVLGMIQLVLMDDLTEEQRTFLEAALKAGSGLVRILNDILDLTKAEAGKLVILREPFNLPSAVEEVIGILSLEARNKGLALSLTMAEQVPPRVLGDRVRLQQVLTNLVANAVKFTEQGSVKVMVTVEIGRPGRSVVTFAVSDTGIGIPTDKQELLFQPFSQVDDSLSRSFGGTGLGLAICREIVTRMGGTIACVSREDEGSVFTVSLPFEAEQQPQVTPATGTVVMAAKGTVSASLIPKYRILVAEDDPVNRSTIQLMLQRSGFLIDLAPNGRQAVEQWEQGGYDLVIMDVRMPVMDGIAATQAIRGKERESGGHVPILALTAHAYQDDVDRCLAAGMDSYLSKPVDLKELIETIYGILGDDSGNARRGQ